MMDLARNLVVGVSAATGATSRYIGFTASLLLLVFASSPRLSGLFLVVPENVAGSLLVFTASFLISSGMEIMLSRSVDTRAVYVIGVSTLLALSEKVFPDYFRALPPAVQSLTASPLALGLMFAIALTLIFRLGTRQTAQTAWSESADAAGTAVAFIQSKTKAWNLAATLIETSTAHTGEVIRYILTKHLSWPEGRLRLTNNGVELGIEISYQGSRTSHVPASREAPIPIANELENEEGPAYAGLQNFLRSLAVDRHQIKTRNGEVSVRLFYAI
jgi:xanthine permease XanP